MWLVKRNNLWIRVPDAKTASRDFDNGNQVYLLGDKSSFIFCSKEHSQLPHSKEVGIPQCNY